MSWKKVSDAAGYYGVSVRTMRTLLSQGFPHSKLPTGTILVELEAGDEWLRDLGNIKKDQEMINELLKGVVRD